MIKPEKKRQPSTKTKAFQGRARSIKLLLQNSRFLATPFGHCEATGRLDRNSFRKPTAKNPLRGSPRAARAGSRVGC